MIKLTTQNGHDFFVVSSCLQKALRRGDIVLAARACNELLPRYANYVWNRLMTVSAEDCAGIITGEVMALYLAYCKVTQGKPPINRRGKAEGRIFFAKAIVLLGKSKHSRDADELGQLVSDRMPDELFAEALQAVEDEMGSTENLEVPDYVYDVHTRQGKRRGSTREDFLRDEHAVMDSSVFANFDEMLATWGYCDPVLDFDA